MTPADLLIAAGAAEQCFNCGLVPTEEITCVECGKRPATFSATSREYALACHRCDDCFERNYRESATGYLASNIRGTWHSFSRLQFGGKSSSFPKLKRSGK